MVYRKPPPVQAGLEIQLAEAKKSLGTTEVVTLKKLWALFELCRALARKMQPDARPEDKAFVACLAAEDIFREVVERIDDRLFMGFSSIFNHCTLYREEMEDAIETARKLDEHWGVKQIEFRTKV